MIEIEELQTVEECDAMLLKLKEKEMGLWTELYKRDEKLEKNWFFQLWCLLTGRRRI